MGCLKLERYEQNRLRLGVIPGGKLKREKRCGNYYPFGKLQEGSWDSDSKFRYLYNGKERQNRLGLGYNRFEARFSDPNIGGRFLALDPIAEDFAFINPYNYAENSPVANIDLHGLQSFSANSLYSARHAVIMKGGDPHKFDQGFRRGAQESGRAAADEVPGVGEALSINEGDYAGAIIGLVPGGKLLRKGFNKLKSIFKKADTKSAGLSDNANVTKGGSSSPDGTVEGKEEIRSLAKNLSPNIHGGKQGKHIRGHNNFIEGRSELTENAEGLFSDLKEGNVVSAQVINDNKNRVDFGREIGVYVNPETGEKVSTTVGIVHNSKKGAHIVPAKPN